MTQSQLIAAIKLKITFGIGVLTSPNNYIAVDDISDYASLLNVGETVKTLYWIQTQVSTTVYKSPGYDTDDFTTPEYPTNDPLAQQALPEDASDDPVEGVYTVKVKAKFDDGVAPFIVNVTISSQPLCLDDIPTPEVDFTWSCRDATGTGSDTTDTSSSKYTVVSEVRALTVYPPDVSGQSPVTVNSTTNTVEDLWTGSYEVKITNTITYKKIVDGIETWFIFYITSNTTKIVVCDDSLCKLYCLLKKIKDEYQTYLGKNPTKSNELFSKLFQGQLEYFLAIQARICSPSSEQSHIDKFYTVTGLDPNCDCGCDGTTTPDGSGAAPVIPTGVGTGTPGADGDDGQTPELRMNSTTLQWKYTNENASAWRNLVDISAFVGQDGVDGATILDFDIFDPVAVGTAAANVTASATLTTISTATIPANTLAAVNDTLELEFSVLAIGANGQYEATFKRTAAGGSVATLATGWLIPGGVQAKKIKIVLKRTGADTIRFTVEEFVGSTSALLYPNNLLIYSGLPAGYFGDSGGNISSFDFTVENTITIKGATATPPNEVKCGMIFLKANKSI